LVKIHHQNPAIMVLSLIDIHQKLEELEVKFNEAEETNKILLRQIKELFLLYNIVKQLNETRHYKEVINTITSVLRKDFHVEEFGAFLYNPKSRILTIRFSYGLPKKNIRDFFYHPTEAFVGQVFNSGNPLYLPDVSIHKNFNYYGMDKKIKGCILYIPLKVHSNESIGVLKMRKPIADSFSNIEQKILPQLGEAFTISLQKGLEADDLTNSAWIDELTGLHTARYFEKRFNAEIRRSQRYQHSLSIIALSIDNMAEISRKNSGGARDFALKEFSQFLKENTRMCDISFRYSINQFLILLPETLKEAAEKAALKIQKTWDGKTIYFHEKIPVSIKLSTGCANYPKDTIEPPVLIKMALEAIE